MVTACAAAGVAVVVMPAFARCHASSASQWLGGAEGAEGREGGKRGKGKRGMIALSLRYRRDDQFYFSLFREAGALLAADRQVRKFDPDAFAREFLIPPAYQDRLAAIGGMASPQAKSSAITELAGELGIAPGLVVGRLQHDGLLGWGEQNQLKCEVDLAQVRQATAAAEGTWPSQHSAALLVMKDLNLEAEAARHRVSRAVAGGAILSSGRQRKGLRLEPGQLAAWRLAMRDRDLDAEERDAA